MRYWQLNIYIKNQNILPVSMRSITVALCTITEASLLFNTMSTCSSSMIQLVKGHGSLNVKREKNVFWPQTELNCFAHIKTVRVLHSFQLTPLDSCAIVCLCYGTNQLIPCHTTRPVLLVELKEMTLKIIAID